MEQNFPNNALFIGDNLDVLRGMNSKTVDLIATDPPFNTKRNRAGTAGRYADKWRWLDPNADRLPDQWMWNEVHPVWLEQIGDQEPALVQVIEATRKTHDDGIAAFLCFMGVRLLEMKRVLKPTGNIFLHCDHNANGYLRMAMDAIFGHKNFKNEIAWSRKVTGQNLARKKFPQSHDTIYYYRMGTRSAHNIQYLPYSKNSTNNDYKYTDQRGRYATFPCTNESGGNRVYEFRGISRAWRFTKEHMEELYQNDMLTQATPASPFRYKKYFFENEGVKVNDFWEDVTNFGEGEKTGAPDQKPLSAYDRIVRAGSNPGDLVLDPFCGCATTMIAARNLGRRFVGIDRRKNAPLHIINRILGTSYEIAEEQDNPKFVEFIHDQFTKMGYHYSEQAPARTDFGDTAHPLPPVYGSRPASMRRADMVRVLVERWGKRCWGCGFEPPRADYLELDHITPYTRGGSNELDNRALLCPPCNRYKSNTLTLVKVRKDNERAGSWYGTPPIDLSIDLRQAANWARNYMAIQAKQGEFAVTA